MQRLDAPSIRKLHDDSYNTRAHAANIGMAYFVVFVAISLVATISFELRVIWFLRGLMVSMLIGVFAFARAMVNFTNEARDIQWESSMPKHASAVYVEDADVEMVDARRAAFPSPDHNRGMLFTTVNMTEEQRYDIADAALQHGKLTVNYLTNIGLKRGEAERLREELAGHNLIAFNQRGHAVVTENGQRSFAKIAQ